MKSRILALAVLAIVVTGCRTKELVNGGIYITRSVCPQVGIPAATGDVTSFDPVGSTDAAAIDVVATITNLRSTCATVGDQIVTTTNFDVVATRRDAAAPRSVVLPYFNVAMQGGTQVIAKRIGQVGLNFAAGSARAQTSSQASIRVSRAATALPKDILEKLTRERKAGEAEAAVDPMSDVTVRTAVAKATFEQLIGFQLNGDQLQYNATR